MPFGNRTMQLMLEARGRSRAPLRLATVVNFKGRFEAAVLTRDDTYSDGRFDFHRHGFEFPYIPKDRNIFKVTHCTSEEFYKALRDASSPVFHLCRLPVCKLTGDLYHCLKRGCVYATDKVDLVELANPTARCRL